MKNLWLFCFGLLMWSCQNPASITSNAKKLIAETLEKETQYFCERNLNKWQQQWSQKPFVSKMYTGKKKFKEFIGWEAVKQNTIDHIKDFPDAIPIPDSNLDYTIELFEDTAFVFYSNNGEDGLVRETRFMVKEDGKWKIARMQTIYT